MINTTKLQITLDARDLIDDNLTHTNVSEISKESTRENISSRDSSFSMKNVQPETMGTTESPIDIEDSIANLSEDSTLEKNEDGALEKDNVVEKDSVIEEEYLVDSHENDIGLNLETIQNANMREDGLLATAPWISSGLVVKGALNDGAPKQIANGSKRNMGKAVAYLFCLALLFYISAHV